MKNTIKMSLVAALAVAGFSTAATAGSLEEAIKGVSISGKFEVEYDYSDSKTNTAVRSTTTNTWDYDWDATAKVPVNDNVTAVFGVQADTDSAVQSGTATSANNDDSDINMSKMYFQYANGPVTALVGKQGKAGAPWFDDERGDGVVALYNAGVATLAAAHFTSTNAPALAGTDITAVAAIGKIGPVNASLWYANIQGIAANQDADSFSINLNGTFDIVTVDARYTEADYDITGGTNDDAELFKITATADLGAAAVTVGYAETGKYNEDSTAGVDLTGDSDAATNFKVEQLALDSLNDAEAFLIAVSVPMNAWTFGLTYLDGEYNSGTTATAAYNETANTEYDFDETLVSAKYAMSKNMKVTGFYSVAEIANLDTDSASIALEYKF
jgi:hypothetical protein